jgi:NADH-quinone oxidoreductase subunit M
MVGANVTKWLPTAITFIPLLFTFIIIAIPKDKELAIKIAAAIGTGLVLVGTLIMYGAFKLGEAGFQMAVRLPWISIIGAEYHMAVDGINLPLVIVTALLTFICVIASWNIKLRVKEYMAMMLFCEVGMIGVFMALDLLLFYVFWELVLIPMYFLIGIWGGTRKEYAAIKFFLYTFVGSVFMLLGILAIYFYSGEGTFNMLKLAEATIPPQVLKLAFLGMFIGFAVKVPMFPFHTWLPDAHVQAPTAASVLLAGVLLKMGTYGFIRIGLQVLPSGMKAFAWLIALMAVISIIYGALCAMVQTDLKKLVAYSSVSHMGYVMLGIASMTPAGVKGAVLQMFSHGIITGMLFLVVGMIYERTKTREISKVSGLFVGMGTIAGIWVFISLASFGLPSLAGFVGEFLVLIGTFPVYRVMAMLAAAGIILTAGYLVWTIQRICFGKPNPEISWRDASLREISYMVPLLLLIVIVGVYPAVLTNIINPSTSALLAKIGGL